MRRMQPLLAARAFGSTRTRVPVIRQLSATECGLACLAMVLSHFGRRTSVVECRAACSVGRDGLSGRDLARVARGFGLHAKGYSVNADAFGNVTLPVIAHWEFNHFVVVERWSKQRVTIVDPAAGRRVLSQGEFSRSFTGVILSCTPSVRFDRVGISRASPWLEYLKSVAADRDVRRVGAQVLLASVVLQGAALALPLLTRIIVDDVLGANIRDLLQLLGVGILLSAVAYGVATYLRARLLNYLRGRLDSGLMIGFLEHLLYLPFAFFQQRSSGDLLMRLNSNAVIRDVLTNQMLAVILDAVLAAGYLVIMLLEAPAFACLAIAGAVTELTLVLLMRTRLRDVGARALAAQARQQGYAVEMMKGVGYLKASGTEGRALERWTSLFAADLNASLERSYLTAGIDSSLGTLRVGVPLALLWLGAWQVLQGGMTIGTMLAMNALAGMFLVPMGSVLASVEQLQSAYANLERLQDVLDEPPEQAGAVLMTHGPRLNGRIEVKRLGFRYNAGSPWAIRDLSFVIEPGQKVALVGSTGSGKSTVIRLLLGLYTPTEGDVTFDGIRLQEMDLNWVRSQVGMVLQESFLFSGSIRSNITLGHPEATLDDVQAAARAAAVHDDIQRMPMGYQTSLSEGGASLSGGQLQRLAIARALISRPAVLLLDEATSHLDACTEAAVDAALSELRCTRIVAAHRLSTVQNADMIFVLDQGRLAEAGTHQTLMEAGGRYEAMMRTQSPLTDAIPAKIFTTSGQVPVSTGQYPEV